MTKTIGEFGVLFTAHEKRDEERFQENKEAMKSALSDVSDAIQLSSKAIMEEVKEMRREVGERFSLLENKVDDLEKYRAGIRGANQVLVWVGSTVIGILMTYLGWLSLQVINMKGDVQSLHDILSSYNITKQ